VSHFSTELRVLLEKRKLSQKAICKKTGIGQGTLSRYLNDVITPDWRMVETIAGAFPDRTHKARLIAAHARDVVHPSLLDKISLGPQKGEEHPQRKTRVRQRTNPPWRNRMPRELLAAYDGLGAEAIEEKRVADLLIHAWRIVQPRRKK
jgi:transcriptional regulator with XRE-family HTH domain